MTWSTKQTLSSLTSIGVYIGKNTFHPVVFDGHGKIVLRHATDHGRIALPAEGARREFRKVVPRPVPECR